MTDPNRILPLLPVPGYWTPTDPTRAPIDGPIGQDLWARADKVIPNRLLYLTRSSRFCGYNAFPGFIESAQGCRITDADGKTYIDFNSTNATNLLGYLHPEVEAVAMAQAKKGDMMPSFSPSMVRFAERLVQWNDTFQWAAPVKRGSDATELALRIARVKTRRPKVVMFKRCYHGTNKELSVMQEGVPGDAWQHIVRLDWNDPAALDAVPQAVGEQCAAVFLNPIDQDTGRPCVYSTPEFMAAVDRFRKRTGAYVILDDCRSGFRIHPKGSHLAMGIDIDLICLGKPLANGYPVAAVLGKEALREGAENILYSSTFLFGAVAFEAAITTIDIYERDNIFDRMMRTGTRLVDGLRAAAAKHGQEIDISGPPTTLTMLYANDPTGAKMEKFCAESARLGAFFHPRVCWFMSGAHQDADIEEALEIADKAFARIAS